MGSPVSIKSWKACGMAAFLGMAMCGVTSARPPWQLVALRRVEADPQKTYELTDAAGPWLIFAASFAGEGAQDDACALVLELRKRFKVPAYIHSQRFDFTQKVQGIGINKDLSPKQMKYDKAGVFDEYAVLVGDFPSVDDPDLQRALKELKYARPECISQLSPKSTLRFAGLRELQKRITRDTEKKSKGPMGNAFATPNPLLPHEYFAPKGVDSLVLRMNKDVPHSLLDCPGKYTVRVATFRGNVVIDQRKVEEIESGDEQMKSQLEQAAIKAHRLTETLRQRNVDAYEFHDRYESFVTVGSFDWVGRPRADGKQEMNPAILRIIQQFSPNQQPLVDQSGRSVAGLQPKTLDGVAFDVQPWPVEVPQRSIATDYVQQQ